MIAIIISDFFDGYLARMRGEVTSLGSLLDPLADKLFVTTSFILLAVYDIIPAWLTIIVVSKDVLVCIGWCIYAMLYGKLEVSPSLLGKTATGLQFFTIFFIIIFTDGIFLKLIEYLTAIVTISALFHYVYQALQQASENHVHGEKETNP